MLLEHLSHKAFSPVILADSIFVDVESTLLIVDKRIDNFGPVSKTRLGGDTLNGIFCGAPRLINADHLDAFFPVIMDVEMLNDKIRREAIHAKFLNVIGEV